MPVPFFPPRYRGFGFGAAILDSHINKISDRYFDVIARCPGDNSFFCAMFVKRGFLAVSRYCRGRILRLAASGGAQRGDSQTPCAIPIK